MGFEALHGEVSINIWFAATPCVFLWPGRFCSLENVLAIPLSIFSKNRETSQNIGIDLGLSEKINRNKFTFGARYVDNVFLHFEFKGGGHFCIRGKER